MLFDGDHACAGMPQGQFGGDAAASGADIPDDLAFADLQQRQDLQPHFALADHALSGFAVG